jgi:hypothetical protein
MTEQKTKTYNCESQVNHDNVLYGVGKPIEMTPGQAESLLKKGRLSDPDAEPAESESDETPAPDNVVKIGEKIKSDDDEGGLPKEEPTDPSARAEFIKVVIIGLDKNNKDHFTNSDKPDANVLSERLGWRVSAAERDAVWDSLNDNAG